MTMYVHCTCILGTRMQNFMPIKQCGTVKLIKLSSMAAKHSIHAQCEKAVQEQFKTVTGCR